MSRKKRIAVIGLKGLPAFGGAAAVGESIIGQLAETFDFTVYAVSSHTDLPSGELNGYRQIVFRKSRLKPLNTPLYFVKSLFHVLFSRYDCVHVHHASSGFIIPLLRLRYKVIVTFHGIFRKETPDPKFGGLVNGLIRFSQRLNLAFASRVISVSKPDTDYLDARYGYKVMYIPNGVFTRIGYEQLPAPEPYMVFAANRVYDIKGLHLVLQALHQLNSAKKLMVIGDLEHKAGYREQIAELAIGLNVEFTGLIKDKKQLFGCISQAELFLFPSLTEAMSMMLLEVASLHIPLIASDIPANRAVLSDEEALFFESGNVEALAAQLKKAFEQPEMLQQLALNALGKVNRYHQWPLIAERYEALFNELG